MMMGCGGKRFRHFKTVQVFIYYCLLVQRLSVITGTTDTHVYKKSGRESEVRVQMGSSWYEIQLLAKSANMWIYHPWKWFQPITGQITVVIFHNLIIHNISATKKRIENVQSEWRKGTEIYKNGSFRSQQQLF